MVTTVNTSKPEFTKRNSLDSSGNLKRIIWSDLLAWDKSSHDANVNQDLKYAQCLLIILQ